MRQTIDRHIMEAQKTVESAFEIWCELTIRIVDLCDRDKPRSIRISLDSLSALDLRRNMTLILVGIGFGEWLVSMCTITTVIIRIGTMLYQYMIQCTFCIQQY